MLRTRCELSCGRLLTPRTTPFGIINTLLEGLDTDDASEEDSDANGFCIFTGTDGTRSGVHGVRGVG